MVAIRRSNKSTPALRRSMQDALHSQKLNQNNFDRMWSTAGTCPLFLKKADKKARKVKGSNGKTKKIVRANRILSNHTIKTLLSGAAASAASNAARDISTLRSEANVETVKYPLLPSMSKPAILLFESFLAAVGSEAFANAADVSLAMKKHRKVTSEAAQVGVDHLNSMMMGSTGFMPQRILATQPATTSKKPLKLKVARADKPAKR